MNKLTTDELKILVDAIHDSATIIHKGQMMNERIQELAKQQAGAILMDLVMPDSGMPERVKWNVGITTEHLEKFAELIVKECIDKITTYDLVPGHSAKWEDIYDIHARLLQDLGEELKQHFGVEE
jgi:hypothetical protein